MGGGNGGQDDASEQRELRLEMGVNLSNYECLPQKLLLMLQREPRIGYCWMVKRYCDRRLYRHPKKQTNRGCDHRYFHATLLQSSSRYPSRYIIGFGAGDG